MTWYGSKVDHLLMPGCPEVENSYQDPFPSLSVFQYSVLIIKLWVWHRNGHGFTAKKKNPPFPSPRSAPASESILDFEILVGWGVCRYSGTPKCGLPEMRIRIPRYTGHFLQERIDLQ